MKPYESNGLQNDVTIVLVGTARDCGKRFEAGLRNRQESKVARESDDTTAGAKL
jgi:hypothetical protein